MRLLPIIQTNKVKVMKTTISIFFLMLFAVSNSYCNKNEQIRQEPSQPASVKAKDTGDVPYVIEVVADNLYVPWSIVFTDSERMLVTERNGKLRVILKWSIAGGTFESL